MDRKISKAMSLVFCVVLALGLALPLAGCGERGSNESDGKKPKGTPVASETASLISLASLIGQVQTSAVRISALVSPYSRAAAMRLRSSPTASAGRPGA